MNPIKAGPTKKHKKAISEMISTGSNQINMVEKIVSAESCPSES